MDVNKLKPLENGSGSYGKCYIVDDNTLYKKFFIDDNGKYPFHKEKLKNLVGIENDSIIFPNELDIVDDYVRGYYMKWIHAPNMLEVNPNISLSCIISALDKLEVDLKSVSDLGVVISDVNFKNVLFKDKFYLVDTDLCWKSRGYLDINCLNQRIFVTFLQHFFLKNYDYYQFIWFLENNPSLESVYCNSLRNKNIAAFKEFLIEYRNFVSSVSECDIDSYESINKVIKLNKK